MSSLIYPDLPGRTFNVKKSPLLNTVVQAALSGKTSRLALQPYPLYSFELDYEFLSDQFSQAPARTNYIPYSQDFGEWTSFNAGNGLAAVVVQNYVGVAAPDGTYTANRVILNLATGGGGSYSQIGINIQNPVSPANGMFSIWMCSNSGANANVNLGFGTNGLTVTVTPSWQRFSLPITILNTANSVAVQLAGGSSTSLYADLLLWGAQLEPGNYATAYIRTNGSPIRVSDLKTMFGLFSQMLGQSDTFLYQDPDFNTVTHQQFATGDGSTTLFNLTATYQPGAEIDQYQLGPTGALPVLGPAGTPDYVENTQGGFSLYTARYGGPELLSRGSRTNLALQSNFAATWTSSNITVTANSESSPDGTTDAASFNVGTATGIHFAAQSAIAITGGGRYTFSCWLKYVSQQYVELIADNGSSDGVVFCFDLVNGLVTGPSLNGTAYASAADGVIENFGNGWYRCSVSGQLATADTSARISIVATNSFSAVWYPSFTGTSGVFYGFGAQFESGTKHTALIPTTTASAGNGGSDYSLTSLSSAGTQIFTFQQVSFNTAPAANVPLLWSGSFWYRCRFSEDKIELQKMMNKIWSMAKVAFESVIV